MIELIFYVLPSSRKLTHRLQAGQSLSLGRENGDLQFPEDGLMSSSHLVVTARDRFIEFEDVGSTNGTFLNGTRVMSGSMKSNDLLVAGQTEISFSVEPSAKTVPPPPQRNISSNPMALRIEGSEATERRVLPGQKLSIGRTDKSDWVFPDDDLMSGIHFILSDAAGQWELNDARSLNGTFLNMEKVDRATLKNGDTIAAGNCNFTVWLERLEQPQQLPSSKETKDSLVPPPLTGSNGLTADSSDTHESAIEGKDAWYSHVWLLELSNNCPALCLRKGSEVSLSSVGKSLTSSKLCIDWTGPRCQVHLDAGSDEEFLINETLTNMCELSNGDQIQWSTLRFQVTYAENGLTVPTWDTPLNKPGNTNPPAHVTPPRQSPSSARVLAKAVRPPNHSPADVSLVAPTATTPTLTLTPATLAPAIVEPVRAKSQIDVCEGPLPSEDPIELLLAVSGMQKCWLISVSPHSPQHLSVPREISQTDPSWMLQIQSEWPSNFFLIVFADAPAEAVLESVLKNAPTPPSFTPKDCLHWLQFEEKAWENTPIQAVILLDATKKSWCLISRNPLPSLRKAVAGA